MIQVEIAVTPTYRYQPDEAPESLDENTVLEWLESVPLPDGYVEAEFTDLETGDFLVITPDA